MPFDQIAIAVLGVAAVWLSQARSGFARRWACVAGMLSAPIWLMAAWKAENIALLITGALYGLAWLRGLWVYWFRPAQQHRVRDSRIGTIQLAPEVKR